MICNVCDGSGFINLHQIPENEMDELCDDLENKIPKWIVAQTEPYDVAVCRCCGDGDVWFGDPGYHYGPDDPQGMHGPYAYNGGSCECH